MPDKGRIAGSKRKRSNTSQKQEDDQAIISKLAGKLHHHVREVRKAAKKAKTFEVQKTVKKLKSLRAKSPASSEIADLEAQLEILKNLDPDLFATTALRTKIHKDKVLTSNEPLTAAVEQELPSTAVVAPAAPGSNESKVHGRVLSSKIIATEVTGVVEALRVAISPRLRKEEDEEEDEGEDGVGEDVSGVQKGERGAGKKERIGGGSASREEDESEGEDEKDEDEDEETDTSSRVEALSDEEEVDDAGWESGSVHDDAGSEIEVPEDSEDEDNIRPSKAPKLQKESTSKAAKPQAQKASKAGESTFLPSLSVGFTRGDSDASDISDDEDVAPKKNRRGQRARRAIWEKKYGRNANHVKKQQEISGKGRAADRARGDGPRGAGHGRAQEGTKSQGVRGQPTRQEFVKPAQDQGWTQRGRGPPPHVQLPHEKKEKKGEQEKPLHPSWAAKRMLKEKQNPSIVPPQGKKIVF